MLLWWFEWHVFHSLWHLNTQSSVQWYCLGSLGRQSVTFQKYGLEVFKYPSHSQFTLSVLCLQFGILFSHLRPKVMDFYPSGITSPNKPPFISCFGCGICHSNRKVTNAEVRTREYAIAVTDLGILMFGGLWNALELWTRETVECCKQSLRGHTSRSSEDSNVESNVDGSNTVQEISKRSNIGSCTRCHECDISTKSVDSFCPLS